MPYHCHGEFQIEGECDGRPRYKKLYAHPRELVYNLVLNVWECKRITKTSEQCNGPLLVRKVTKGSAVLGIWTAGNEAICGTAPEVCVLVVDNDCY